MAYILGVNPVILGDGGMPATGVLFATAIASGVACIIMGLVAKYPVGLAPGMGLNALFTYTIILTMGNCACCGIHFKHNLFDNHHFRFEGSYFKHHPS